MPQVEETIPSTRIQDGHLLWPGPSSEAAPFLHVHCRGQKGVPQRLWALMPHPCPLPWPPSPVAPQKGMYESPFLLPPSGPSAQRYIGFQISLPTTTCLPGPLHWRGTFGTQDFNFTTGLVGEGQVAPKMANILPFLCISLVKSSASDHSTLRGFLLPQ